ncbi:WD repeat protein [Penicillium chermesinum]|nr:WD repeat protein [Penicillium chermesinum]
MNAQRRSILLKDHSPREPIQTIISSSGSPKLSENTTRRRSNRQRKDPSTYNLRILSGLEKEQITEPSSAADGDSVHGSVFSRPPDLSKNPPAPPNRNIERLLLNRELQGQNAHGTIHKNTAGDLKKWKSWTGASSDVVALAWSPDGTRFAAGAIASPDVYNRNNNLLVGDLVSSALYELPDHWTLHPSNGERIYASVTDTQWVGQRLYTSSYDNTVKIWDAGNEGRPSRVGTLQHDSQVVVMAVSGLQPNLIATGTKSFQLWNIRESQSQTCKPLPIQRSNRQKSGIDLRPTTLAWGPHHMTSQFLVGGMTEQADEEFRVPSYGHIGLWRIGESSILPGKLDRGSQNVFDIRRGSVATSACHSYNNTCCNESSLGFSVCIHERLPCTAADINVVGFCPVDSLYVTAGCTDGRTYVWDIRNSSRTLHRLNHGKPLDPLNHEHTRELTDFGVTVTLWGSTIDHFYTGASDGCLNRWDIRRSPEDALRETFSFGEGIVSGSFSGDKSQLLIGDHRGGISILSSAPMSDPSDNLFAFERAPDDTVSDTMTGVQICEELLTSGQLEMDPIYGPVQGPNYKGPYALWARGLSQENSSEVNPPEAPLLREYQLRQFHGAPPRERDGLDAHAKEELERRIRLAKCRNNFCAKLRKNHRVSGNRKRKRRSSGLSGKPSESGGKKEMKKKRKKEGKKNQRQNIPSNMWREHNGVIDLTGMIHPC